MKSVLASILTGPSNSSSRNPDEWMWETFGGRKTSSGERISEKDALRLSAVWACVNVISQTTSSLPLNLYRSRKTGGKDPLTSHPLQRLLHDAPNPDMTAMQFRETLQAHTLTWGNGYAEIVRNGSGRPVELWPIDPSIISAKRTDAGALYYQIQNSQKQINPINILHIPGMSYDGVVGYSIIRMAREGLGLTSASEKFGAALFGNGAIASGVMSIPGELGQEAYDRLKKSLNEEHVGAGEAHKPLLLEGGLQFTQTSIPPDDAQFLETRKFQTEEIARWFNVPLYKIKNLDKATFSNIEQQAIEFVVDTIRPWLVRWEQEIKRKLIMPNERGVFAEHKVDALLRGDTKARYEAYNTGRTAGFLSVNDIRGFENMNPVEGGDIYLTPLNMTDAATVGNGDTDPDEGDDSVANALLKNACTNVATKEFKGISKNCDRDDYEEWIDSFFGKHAAFVADMLQISVESAEKDIESLINSLKNGAIWPENRAESLYSMAKEVHKNA